MQTLTRTLLSPVLTLLSLLSFGNSAKSELIFVTLETSVVSFNISSGNSTAIAASKTTVASGLNEAMGLVFGGDEYLYVVQFSNNAVTKIDPSNGTKTAFASGFTNPRGITYDAISGNYYVANSNVPGSISEVTSGGLVSTYLNSGIRAPYGLAFDGNGSLYAANNGNATLTQIVGGVPSTLANYAIGAGTRGTAVGQDGNIYTSVANGVQVTTPQGATSAFIASGMGFPYGLAWSSAGNLYVASYTNNAIFAYNSAGTPLYNFSTGAGSSNRPRFVAFDIEGSGFNQVQNAAVPEPGQVAASLLLLGGIGSYVFWKRRKSAKATVIA